MEIPTIKAESRQAAGSRAAARLRRKGKLPAIVYGHKQDPLAVALEMRDVELQISHGAHLVNLDVQGKVQPCLIKDAQYDHLGAELVHLDLARVDLNETVKVHVTLELRGTPKGAAEGGQLRQDLMELEVECLVTNIPENIRVSVADLALNQVLYVKDLKLDAGIRAVNDPETVVATCRVPQVQAEVSTEAAAPVEGAAEPEVIAKGKIEEEGAEGAEKEKPAKAAKE
ncbi:MAG TPA: 50S ribosomal protein L25 [Phycisphaerae bacterium]|nr:50S ribosomal protein L25 [Phycisphaerae bacterium]